MIKLNRALRQCNFRAMQEREILNSLPQILIERLTSSELATVMQALDTHWHKAQAATEQQILDEVCIWSDQQDKLLDLSIKHKGGAVQVL